MGSTDRWAAFFPGLDWRHDSSVFATPRIRTSPSSVKNDRLILRTTLAPNSGRPEATARE